MEDLSHESQAQELLAQQSQQLLPTEGLPMPTQTERGLAALVHVISLFAPLWGPLIGGVVARGRSRYVEVHSWKALKEYFILTLGYFVYGAISITISLVRLYNYWQNNWENFNWMEILLRFAIGWLILLILAGILLVLNVIQAYKAWKGEWPKAEIKKQAKKAS